MPLSKMEQAQLRIVGQNIRRERLAIKLTQEKTAELVNLNIRNLQKIEAGELNILVTTLVRIQQALQCPWERILPIEPPITSLIRRK